METNPLQSNHDEWQRYRKIIAPVLNERIMESVWNETTRQTEQMTTALSQDRTLDSSQPGLTDRVHDGIRTVAINVIAATSYGSHQDWAETQNELIGNASEVKTKMTFMKSILLIVNSHVLAVFIPSWILSSKFMPKSMRDVGTAAMKYPVYSKELIAKERTSADTSNSLLSTMVAICDNEKANTQSKSSSWLTEDEVSGNLFNFALAGFDTTSNSTAYALAILAMQPKWQDWIREEIDRVNRSHPQGQYNECFPELNRCMAVLVCLPS
jgi:cytochrome P450